MPNELEEAISALKVLSDEAAKLLLIDEIPDQIRKIKRKYVISKSHSQFEFWRNQYQIPKEEIIYVHLPEQICGIDCADSYIFFWGQWWENYIFRIGFGREILERYCRMVMTQSLGAKSWNLTEMIEFIRFCAANGMPFPFDKSDLGIGIIDFFAQHSNPNEEISHVREPR